MKVRNKSRNFTIQKIYIDSAIDRVGCRVSFVCNNQYMELFINSTYIDVIMQKIEEYLKVVSDDNIYYKV